MPPCGALGRTRDIVLYLLAKCNDSLLSVMEPPFCLPTRSTISKGKPPVVPGSPGIKRRGWPEAAGITSAKAEKASSQPASSPPKPAQNSYSRPKTSFASSTIGGFACRNHPEASQASCCLFCLFVCLLRPLLFARRRESGYQGSCTTPFTQPSLTYHHLRTKHRSPAVYRPPCAASCILFSTSDISNKTNPCHLQQLLISHCPLDS